MNEDTIRMARDAGFELAGLDSYQEFTERLNKFAQLVVDYEREQCAKICDELRYNGWEMVKDNPAIAKKIRARGQL